MRKFLFLILFAIALSVPKHAVQAQIQTIELTPENTLFLVDMVNPFQLAELSEQIESTPSIEYLVVASPGGYILGIEEFSDVVSKYPRIKIIVVFAHSAAAAITQLTSNEKIIVPAGNMIFHRIRAGYGDMADLTTWLKRIQHLQEQDDLFAKQCRSKLNITEKEYNEKTVGKDWHLNADEALKMNAVQRIGTAKCNPALRAKKVNVDVFNYLKQTAETVNVCSILAP